MTPAKDVGGMVDLMRGLSTRAERSAPEAVDVTQAVLVRLHRARPASPQRGGTWWKSLVVAGLIASCGWYWITARRETEPDVGNPLAELLTSSGLQLELAEANTSH